MATGIDLTIKRMLEADPLDFSAEVLDRWDHLKTFVLNRWDRLNKLLCSSPEPSRNCYGREPSTYCYGREPSVYCSRRPRTNSDMLSEKGAAVLMECGAIWMSSVQYEEFMDKIGVIMERFVKRGNYHHVPRFLDYISSSLYYRREFQSQSESAVWNTVRQAKRDAEGIYKNKPCDSAVPSQHSQHAFTVAVAAVLHLLAFVLQYLIGYIDRGGTKTYSSGCFDFRASYVSVMLFLAAFVWIKFRQAARPSTGKRKQPEHPVDDANDTRHVFHRKYGTITKYEARYLIPVKMRDEAHPVKYPRLTLGEYESPEVAAFVWRVAETCYEGQRGTCCVTLQGNPYTFPVPAMSEQERGLVGEEKRKWVMEYAKVVGKNEYEKYAMQLALDTSTGSHHRFQARRTCQPSLMLDPTPYEPQNGSDTPSCSVPPPVGEEDNAGSEPFQLNHHGPAQGLESRIITEGVIAQWHRESPPSGGLPTDIYSEEFMRILEEISPDPPFEQESPLGRNMPYSDSALLEDDSSPIVESEGATVEHPRLWSAQTSQQGDASDAVLQYADRSGTAPVVVEQSTMVLYQQQNPQVIQEWESQLAEPSQHISNRSGEPFESILQQYEHLLKDNELLRKEKELAEQEKERWREKYERLENSIVALASKSVLALDHD